MVRKRDFLEIKKESGGVRVRVESWALDAKIEKAWLIGLKVVEPPRGAKVEAKKGFEKLVPDPSSTISIICTIEALPFAVIALREGDLLAWRVEDDITQGEYSPYWTIHFSVCGGDPPLVAEARHVREAIALSQVLPPLREIIPEICGKEFLLKLSVSDFEKIITHLEVASEELDAPLHVRKPEEVLVLYENLNENRRVALVYNKAENDTKSGRFSLVLQHYGKYAVSYIDDSPDGMRATTPSPYHAGYIDYKEFKGWHSLRPEEWTDKDRELYEKYKKFVEEDPDIQAWKRQWRRREEVLKNELEYCYKRRQLYNALGLPRTDAYITHVVENLRAWKEFLYGGG